ncbi:sensor histidine kinase [Paractinoplanes atraurantiacus]|uniref:histidine kinase n=1 Tax=Paractinoplanes atraurantiacus TaxID=1036182 RepID=A0A285H4L2_9ACTN|nr:nitrate- and nitrite sensing domain-containing protein [Actinoplanes atraurantiacus]SNY30534.1 Signal transduction histidine kinase [Actinoplanes atraurantiacus]
MRTTRYWSIRSKIIALAAVPLTALLALWLFATALTAGPAFNLLSARTVLDTIGNPGIELVGHLQRERLFTVEYLSAKGPIPGTLTEQRAATDKAIADFRRQAGSERARDAASDALRSRVDQFFTQLDSLAGNREHINRREMDPIGGQNFYNNVIASGFQTFAATATFDDERIDRELRALTTVGQGQEYLSRVDALVGGATARGLFDPETRGQLIQDVGTARFLLGRGVEDMAASDRTAYNEMSGGDTFSRLDAQLTALVQQSRDGAVSPVSSGEFRPTYVAAARELREFETAATGALTDRARPLAENILVRLGLAAILGLAALAFSVYLSVRVGRSIVGRLRRLHGEAREMATERLPTVVRRLQRGEEVDVDVETPPLAYGHDEIGQLGQAFNEVQRTAVQSAVEEASVRRGLNEVFLNIARRSQTLLHRQLALLDRMERRETEPQELEDLYRVDHLATRMRRHAEDLVILAGAAPGRGWRNPVPVIDVIRGAISEVEDYKRVDIRSVESASVLGRAVGDVIHLLAELLENAASFSPPHTRVQVSGQVLPNGYAMEIEDRGLGMTTEAIDEANRRLAEPPDFDPADSARLGLFVVAQLANRHGIRVSLRASAYAGVTAIVLVPGDLVAPGTGLAALPAAGKDRPLVGSGTDDPSRHSLAELQWQGTEELRQLTVPGRPVTINGTATPSSTDPEPAGGGQHRAPATTAGGPSPSAIAEGLTEEGLVQRKRVRRPIDLTTTDPADTVPGATTPPATTQAGAAPALPEPAAGAFPPLPDPVAGAFPPLPDPVVSATPAAPQPVAGAASSVMPTSAAPLFPTALPTGAPSAAPTSAAPMFIAPISPAAPPAPSARPASGSPPAPPARPASGSPPAPPARLASGARPSPAEPGTPAVTPTSPGVPLVETEDGLPKRVRQASVAAQLRRRAGAPPPAAEDEASATLRSPEQVRSIMSALQSGTTRGRIDASRYLANSPERNSHAKAPRATDSVSEERSNPDDTGNDRPSNGGSFADAATVSFPAIVNASIAREQKSEEKREQKTGGGEDAADPGSNDVTRSEKDA